jgi:hypothetical protein
MQQCSKLVDSTLTYVGTIDRHRFIVIHWFQGGEEQTTTNSLFLLKKPK